MGKICLLDGLQELKKTRVKCLANSYQNASTSCTKLKAQCDLGQMVNKKLIYYKVALKHRTLHLDCSLLAEKRRKWGFLLIFFCGKVASGLDCYCKAAQQQQQKLYLVTFYEKRHVLRHFILSWKKEFFLGKSTLFMNDVTARLNPG